MGRSGAALVLFVALVAAGVVGMHTLGLHGTAHGGHDAAAAAAPAAPVAPVASAASGQARAALAHDGHPPAAVPDGSPAYDDPVAAACLFLLVLGVLVALLAPVLRRLPRGWLPLPRPGGSRVVVRALVACTRPPPTWEHSVVRC